MNNPSSASVFIRGENGTDWFHPMQKGIQAGFCSGSQECLPGPKPYTEPMKQGGLLAQPFHGLFPPISNLVRHPSSSVSFGPCGGHDQSAPEEAGRRGGQRGRSQGRRGGQRGCSMRTKGSVFNEKGRAGQAWGRKGLLWGIEPLVLPCFTHKGSSVIEPWGEIPSLSPCFRRSLQLDGRRISSVIRSPYTGHRSGVLG